MILALQWIEEKEILNTVIASDSFSALSSIRSGRSSFGMDLIQEVFLIMFRLQMKGIFTRFIWVPAHVGVKGNEQVDILAKQALKISHVDLQVPLRKAKVKSFSRTYAQNTWQEHWGMSETGRHLYNIQRHVGDRRKVGFKRRDENIITRLRIGHTGLNYSLHKIVKQASQKLLSMY